jgi:hypothetical protein
MKLTDLQSLLVDIRSHFPHAVIAGGAPRDAYFGRPIKDIDVMVPGVTQSALHRLTLALVGKLKTPENDDPSGDGSFEWLIERDGALPLNIIDTTYFDCDDPVDNIHDFDFALSRIGVTPNGVIFTPEFQADNAMNTCTFMIERGERESWRLASSARRLVRLKAKYPLRRFVNVSHLAEYLK